MIAGLVVAAMLVVVFAEDQSKPGHRPSPAKAETVTSAKDHLRAAGRSLNEALTAAGVTGDARVRVAQLASYYNELDLNFRGKQAGYLPGAHDAERPRQEWQRQLDAITSVLTELLGPSPAAGAKLDPAAGILRDERVRTKLQDMRAHLQQFSASAK
jgi:hypothetical protein